MDMVRPGHKLVSWGRDTLSSTVKGDIQCALVMRIPIYQWAHDPRHDLDVGLVLRRDQGKTVRIGVFSQSRSDAFPLFDDEVQSMDIKELVIF